MKFFINGIIPAATEVFSDATDEGFFLWPMLSFFSLVAGLICIIMGVVNIQSSKKEWSLYFSVHSGMEDDQAYMERKAKMLKTKKTGYIQTGMAIVFFILIGVFSYLYKLSM